LCDLCGFSSSNTPIRKEGAEALAEMLKVNNTITSVE
jgi:hypothetical protein